MVEIEKMRTEPGKEKNESKLKKLTGADLIIGLFLIVAVPHNSFTLIRFENAEWWPLGWLLAAAIDVGIAYGAAISSQVGVDKEARRWATVLFVGLSVGSYSLNMMHYIEYGASWYSLGLGAFFPIGIMLLAKIKSRLISTNVTGYIKQGPVGYFPQEQKEKQGEEHPALMAEETAVERLEGDTKNEERWKIIQPSVEFSSTKNPQSNPGYGMADGGSLGNHEETIASIWTGEDATGEEVLIGRDGRSDEENSGSTVEEVRKVVRAFRRGTLTNEEFEEESRQLMAGREEAVKLEELLKLGRAFRNKKLTAGEVDQSIAELFSTARSRASFEEQHFEQEETQ